MLFILFKIRFYAYTLKFNFNITNFNYVIVILNF